MARDPREQQKTDAERIDDAGTGTLDRDAAPGPPRSAPAPSRGTPVDEEAWQRITRERDAAIAALRRLGTSPGETATPIGLSAEAIRDEGDEAQASERREMRGVHRERLADRINRLTRALERLSRGTYEVCEVCGNPIARERLAALPEVTTCRDCQERLEREAA